MVGNSFGRNVVLAAVEPEVRSKFIPNAQLVELSPGQILYNLGDRLSHVYFPVSGLIGILSETPDGDMIDNALVGAEGAVGVFEACGSRHFYAEAAVQVPGQAMRLSAECYRRLFESSPALRTAVHRYVEELMNETRQSVACNSVHEVEGRLCRRILEALEKSRLSDTLPLTQGTMARMLGAQRTTVSEILARLERDGVVTKRRGALVIEDRAALERLCCGCRIAVRMVRDAIWAEREPACEAAVAAE